MARAQVLRVLPHATLVLSLVVALSIAAIHPAPPVPTTLFEASNPPAPTYVGDLPNVTLETADGTQSTFAATDGHIRITTLFYSHCPGVCPLMLQTLQSIDSQLTPAERSKLHFVLLSLDPTRDTPQQLRAMASERHLQPQRWLLARTSPDQLSSFATALHVQYRPLSDGSVDHSSVFTLLNEQGKVIARTGDTQDPTNFVTAVRRALDTSPR